MLPIIILAGGLATRLRPITEKIPKSMVQILGRPFIDWQLELLARSGYKEIIISVNYLGNYIEDHIGNGQQFGLNVRFVYDGIIQLGTGGAITKASEGLKGDFAVIYGDSYLPINYAEVEEAFLSSDKLALMTVYKNKNVLESSNLEFINGKIERYSKKNKNAKMQHIDYGLEYFKREVFSQASGPNPLDLADLLESMVKNDEIEAFLINQRFFEVGSFQGIKDLETYLESSVL